MWLVSLRDRASRTSWTDILLHASRCFRQHGGAEFGQPSSWEQDEQIYSEIRAEHKALKFLDLLTFPDAGDDEAADVLREIGDAGHRVYS